MMTRRQSKSTISRPDKRAALDVEGDVAGAAAVALDLEVERAGVERSLRNAEEHEATADRTHVGRRVRHREHAALADGRRRVAPPGSVHRERAVLVAGSRDDLHAACANGKNAAL